jgi:hypothetical protein
MSAVSCLSFDWRFIRPLAVCLSVFMGAGSAVAADSAGVPDGVSDFTRICWNGEAEGQGRCSGKLQANTGISPGPNASGDWACTRDNARKLVWSLVSVKAKAEQVFVPGFSQAGHDASARCGFSSGWRLPTRSELAGIVKPGRTPGPMQESSYFPPSGDEQYWTSETFSTDPGYGWGILYGYNGSIGYYRTLPTHMRLVHVAQ